MKKIYPTIVKTLIVLLLVAAKSLNAQVSLYSFSQSVGSFDTLVGGTVLGSSGSDDQRFVDPAAPAGGTTNTGVGLPIGFSFTYNGTAFDRFAVNYNGWISLGQSIRTPSVNIGANTTTPLSSTTTISPAVLRNRISALAKDLQGQANSQLSYQTIGTSPNQVLVVEWKNVRRYGDADTLTFQIRLHETSNLVEIQYGSLILDATITPGTVQVGLGGSAAADFNNRTTTTDWNNTTAGTSNSSNITLGGSTIIYPVAGTVFAWSPPAPCSGTPAAGTVTPTPAHSNPGSTYSVTASGYTPAAPSSLTFQWQKDDGSGWANAATLDTGYAALTGQTAGAIGSTVNYRVIVSCLSSGLSDTSAAAVFTSGVCTPTGSASSTSYYLNNITTTGGVTNLNYTASSFAGYVDSSATQFSQYVGGDLNISLASAGGNTYYYYGWIDLNGDGDFADAGETLFAYTTYTSTYSYTVTIPSALPAGAYRVRFADNESGTAASCGTSSYGNFVDFTFNALALPVCSGTPVAGAAVASPDENSAGGTYSVLATGLGLATGLTYQWQSNTGGAGWVNVGSADTAYSALTGQVAPAAFGTTVQWQLIVTCDSSGLSDTSAVATFTTGYCAPTGGGSSTSYYLNTISTTGGLTNLSYSASSYSAYVNNSATQFSQYAGASVTANLDVSSGTSYFFGWVDWNNDGDFDDSGEEVFSQTSTYSTSYTGVIAIPAGQAPGNYRVRFAQDDENVIVACGPADYGDYVDFTLNVPIPPVCTGAPSAGTASASPAQAAPGSSYTVSATGLTAATALTYLWQSNTDSAGWVNAGTTDTMYSSLGETAGTIGSTVQYRLIVTCDSSGLSDTSALAVFTSGYCIPTGGSVSTSYYLSSVTTTGGLSNLNYTAASYQSYVNTGIQFAQRAGDSVSVSLNAPSSLDTYVFAGWVDWNNDGVFDSTEVLFDDAVDYTNPPYTAAITVPSAQAPGNYRVRFAIDWISPGSTWDPCGNATEGNYVDFTLNVPLVTGCNGTPTAGAASVSPTQASGGSAYTVSDAGYSFGQALTYQWQSNTNNAGWVNVGTTDTSYSNPAGQTAPAAFGSTVQWRLIVTCTNTSTSDTSSVAVFTTNYCIPTGGTSDTSFYLTPVTTTGGVTNLNYTASSYAAYVDNTASQFSQYPGAQVFASLSAAGNDTYYFYGWVDWNNDGDFNDAGEAVFSQTTYVSSYVGTINVPVGQAYGSYRARFAVSDVGTITACGPAPYGNYVDFTLNVLIPPACTGVPNAGTVAASPSQAGAGSTYTVTTTGLTSASSLTYLWQSNTNSAGWVNVGTTDTSFAPLTPTAGAVGEVVQYRLIVTCTVSGASDTSNTTTFTSGYCTPSGGSSSTLYYINSVATTGGLTNLSYTASSFSGYVNSGNTFSQYPGAAVNLSIGVAGGSDYVYAGWVDWNNDGDFSDPGETLFATNTYTFPPYTSAINIPAGTSPGNHRVRFAASYLTIAWDPCGSIPDGNYVDFTLNVITPPACTGTPSAGTVVVTPVQAGAGSSYNVTVTGLTAAVNLTYQWQSNTDSAGWVNAGTTDTTYASLNETAGALGEVVQYRLIVTCANSGVSDTSAAGAFTSGYCQPVGGTSDNFYYLNSVSTTGGLTNVSYSASSFTGYVDNSSAQFEQTGGASVSVHLGGSSTIEYFGWVDWNNDGDFSDPGETIFTTTSYTSTYVGVINVPAGQPAGNYRVRFASSGSGSVSSCGPAAYGNYVDFTLNVPVLTPCTGAPAAGTVSVSPIETSNGSAYTVSDAGFTFGQNLTYQWQSNTDSAGWVNAGTADTSFASLNETAGTFGSTVQYRLIVACGNSGLSDTSNVALFRSGYCQPAGGTSSTYYYLNAISTTGGLSNLSYSASSFTGYVNNSATQFSQVGGASVNVNLGGSSTIHYYAWVDWNSDGDFSDPGETIFTTTSYTSTYAGVINVPAGQPAGNYRVRFASSGSAAVTSCGPAAYGNYVDFTLNVPVLTPCTGAPNTGAVSVSPIEASSGSAYTVSSAGFSFGQNLTYQWQSNTDSAGWVNTGTADTAYSNYTATAGVYGETVQWRLIVTCNNSGISDTSNVALFKSGYCAPSGGSSSTSYYLNSITTTGGLSNLNYTASSYAAYVNNSATQFAQIAGGSVNVSLASAGGNTYYYYGWVDWNNDGDFADPGETIFATTSYTATYNGIINVPAGQASGNYRVRFASSELFAITSCGSAPYGNYVDFTLVVPVLTPCTGTPTAGTVSVSPTETSNGSTYTVIGANFTFGQNLTYQWQSNTDSAGWVNVGTADTSYSNYTATAGAYGETVQWRLIVTCANSGLSDTSTVASITSLYCIPTGGVYDTYYYINSVTTTGGLSNLNYSATAFTGYVDSSAAQFSQNIGGSVNLSIGVYGGTTYYYAGWIDWNNDGDFNDPGETLFGTTSDLASPYTYTIVIPANQTPGNYRVRFASDLFSNSWDACGDAYYGNYVDFTLNIPVPPPCTTTVVGGTATGPSTADAYLPAQFVVTGDTGSIQWQYSTVSANGPFIPFTGTSASQDTLQAVFNASGTYWVRAYLYTPGCVSDSSNSIEVTVSHSGDDVCDAVVLSFGTNGPFSTVNATVQAGEPLPPGGDCAGPLSWCDFANDVTNSLWFTFVAPASGRVSIQSPGFDTQLALWEADNCDTILNGGATLLGAVDDDPDYSLHGGVEFSSYITAICLTPGRTYYVQLDPYSAPGGTTPIILTDLGGTTPPTTITVNSVTNVTCNGYGNGAINVTVSGGSGNYSYLWNTFDQTANIAFINGGDYVLTVTDIGCNDTIVSDTIVVVEPDLLNAALDTVINVSCYGGSTGAIYATVTGGTTPYSYLWSNNATTANLVNVPAGSYTGTVTDVNGCTFQTPFPIPVTEPSTSLVAVLDSIVDNACVGGTSGAIYIHASGGGTSYTYNWSDSVTTQNNVGVAAGNYSVSVTDNNGCVDSTLTQLTVQDGTPFNVTVDSVTNSSCAGLSTGAVYITVTGGNPGYVYGWSNADSTEDITNLAAGTYSVTVSDTKSCSATASGTVANNSAVTVAVDSVTNNVCAGGSAGAVYITVSGGTPAYTYLWSDSAAAEDISGLTAGTYTVTVQDVVGCTASNSATVTEGTPILVTVDSLSSRLSLACHGDANGSVYISVSGGVPNYTYLWNNNLVAEDITGLTAGTYSVVVTDSIGCTGSLASSVAVVQPTALAYTIDSALNVKCYGNANGAIYLTPSGGTPPTNIAWSNGAHTDNITGLVQGTYTAVLTDSNGCTKNVSQTITQPSAALGATAVATPEIQGGAKGTVQLSVTGGTAPYSYAWSNGATTENISNLSAGTYTVTVKDANGCTVTASAVVQFVTGIGTVETSIDINLYPNPTQDVTFLELSMGEASNVVVDVYNVAGQFISHFEELNATYIKKELDFSNEASGVYYAKIRIGNTTLTRRIVVTK